MEANCRLCGGLADYKHRCALFSPSNTKKDLSGRVSRMLGVPVHQNDGRPAVLCRHCMSKFLALETDLEGMKQKARATYDTFPAKENAGSRKRPKDTSGSVVSPFTASVRPPAKRMDRCRLFADRDMNSFGPPPTNVSRGQVNPSDSECSSAVAVGHRISPSVSMPVQVVVHTPHLPTPYTTELPADLLKIGRALAGGHMPTIAKAVYSYAPLKQEILLKVFDMVSSECGDLCKKGSANISCFRKIPLENMAEFEWAKCIDDLKKKAPTLLQLLSTVVQCNDHRNTAKRGDSHNPGISMAVAVLLKERNREMCGLQSLIALLLFKGQAHKKVYTYLNHINVTLSYNAMLKLVSDVSKKNEAPLKKWITESSPSNVKFIGDNVSTTVGVRDIRSDHQSHLKHMYSILVVKGRVPNPPNSDQPFSPPPLTSLSCSSFLPTEDDIAAVKKNLTILVSRILVKHVKPLKCFDKVVPKHIWHDYSDEMAEKSEVAVIDVLHKNETCNKDMHEIMLTLQSLLGDDFSDTLLSGGDQVTCERQKCVQRHVMDSDTPAERLEMLEPVVEDWHTLMCFLTLTWKVLFGDSSRDHGTLGQLFSLIKRLPAARKPKEDMHACTDALFTVLKGYIVAAACKELGIDIETESIPSHEMKMWDYKKRLGFIVQLSMKVVEKYTLVSESILCQAVEETGDKKYDYSRTLCHYACLALEFTDAWAEGDGMRVLRCWRIFLPHFSAGGRTKYSLESLRLQIQLAVLPPHLVKQLTWGRFINTHGGLGRNIPCDLHNEHFNKLFKEAVAHMGANFSEDATTRVARSVTFISHVANRFECQTNIHPDTTAHTTRSNDSDVQKVVKVILREKLWDIIPTRTHHSFKNVSSNPLKSLKLDKLNSWIADKLKETMKYRRLQEDAADSVDSD